LISQRDIVEIPFNLPQGVKHHPAIVLSNNEAIQDEEAFVALMMTTEKSNDLYTFEITSDMLSKKLHVPYCEARLHLISFFRTKEVVANSHYNNKIKPEFFQEMIKQINRITFGLEVI
jgi:mRNA-degrading endonuclease toxin of MazEF toxin-antitoxin module